MTTSRLRRGFSLKPATPDSVAFPYITDDRICRPFRTWPTTKIPAGVNVCAGGFLSSLPASSYIADIFPYIADDNPYFTDDNPYIADDRPYIADRHPLQATDITKESNVFGL